MTLEDIKTKTDKRSEKHHKKKYKFVINKTLWINRWITKTLKRILFKK